MADFDSNLMVENPINREGNVELSMKVNNEETKSAEANPPKGEGKRVVRLRRVIKIKREFDGFGGLLFFVVYACISAIIPTLLMDFYDGMYRSKINAELANFNSYEGDDYDKGDLHTPQQLASYASNFMRTQVDNAIAYDYENEDIFVADAKIKFAYLQKIWDPDYLDKTASTLNLVKKVAEGTQKIKKSFNPECTDSNAGKISGPCIGTNESAIELQNGIRCYYRNKHFGTSCVSVIIGYEGNNSRTISYDRAVYWDEVFLPQLQISNGDYIKGGGGDTGDFDQITIVTENPRVSTVGSMNVLFTDTASETGTTGAVIYGGPVRVRGLYSSHWRDGFRAFFEAVFMFVTVYMAWDEYKDYKVTTAQAYHSTTKYFKNFWNIFDCLSIFILFMLYIIQFCVVLPQNGLTYQSGGWPKTFKQFLKYTNPASNNLQTLIYFWTANFLLTGGRGFKYFRSHRGLGVYVEVFARTLKTVQDFLIWFIAVIGWLTVAFNLIYTLVGANVDLGEPGSSLNTIGLLTFGYYDYETLYNDGAGFGYVPWIPTILFWLLVFITIMFAQNIILAIVGNAYTDCAEKVGEDDMPFIRFTIRRIIYEVLCKWPHLKDGAVSFGHKSTRVMEKKVDIIKVTNKDTQEEAVQKTAEMISRRDNQMLYRKGKIVQVSDSYCFGKRYLVQYTEGATNTVYEEKVRIGAIQAINSHIEDRGSTHEKKEWKKDNYVSIPSFGDEVFVRYFGIWTEKIYLQYETCKSDLMDGFFAYFQDTTRNSPKFPEGWLFDRGISIHKAWQEFLPFKEGDPSWDWENPDSLLDYPLTYEQLQIITKAVCESLTERFPGLFTECKGDQTVELARNIFVAFSEPLESEDDKSNADKDDLTELKREVAKLNSKILPVKLQADMQETLRAISAKLGELDAKISELGRAKIDGAEKSKGEFLTNEISPAEKVLYVSISQEEVDEASKRSEELERKAAEAEKAQQELEGNVESLQKEQAAKAQRRLADIKALETKIESKKHQKGDTDSLDTLKSTNERAAKEESEKLENLRESGRKASVAVKQYRAEADKANVAAAQLKAKKINRLKFDLSWGYPSADDQDFLDATCFLLSRDSGKWAVASMVDYNNRDADGVQHSGDHQGETRGTHTINITLDNLPEKVEWLFFSMSAYNADSIAKFKEPMLHLTNDDSGEEITNYDNSKVVDTRALLICYARKKAMGKWEVNGMSMPSGGSANDYTELSESCIKFAEARS